MQKAPVTRPKPVMAAPPCPPETDECRIILICTCSETPLRTAGAIADYLARGRNLLG